MAFIISYSRLQLYNKRTLAKIPVNFEKIFTEHPKAIDLSEILPLLSKQHFSYFIETVALAQANEKSITEKWGPGL